MQVRSSHVSLVGCILAYGEIFTCKLNIYSNCILIKSKTNIYILFSSSHFIICLANSKAKIHVTKLIFVFDLAFCIYIYKKTPYFSNVAKISHENTKSTKIRCSGCISLTLDLFLAVPVFRLSETFFRSIAFQFLQDDLTRLK